MKNIIKGWATTIIGLAIIVIDILYFFGLIKLPASGLIDKPYEAAFALIVGLILLLVDETWIEEQLKDYIKKKKDADTK